MKKSLIAKIVSIIFIIILIIGIACLLFIPKLYNLFKESGVPNFEEQNIYYKVAFYLCYIICLVIVYKLRDIFNRVYKKSVFVISVESSLKVISVLFMILFLIILVKAFFIPTLLSFAVGVICFVASLSFYVLAEVIKSAIEYKKEIDYTV